jgi:hypothetical protein
VRPLDRRFAKIARPARVRMRARKPCLRARRRLLGWKVRFISWAPGKRSGREGAIQFPEQPAKATVPALGWSNRGGPTGQLFFRDKDKSPLVLCESEQIARVTTPLPHLWINVWTNC